MLAILLGILKWVGIVLAVIVAIVFIILAIALFCPLRYHISGEKKDAIRGKVTFSFFLHVFATCISYDKEALITVKLFGIPVYKITQDQMIDFYKYIQSSGSTDKKEENEEEVTVTDNSTEGEQAEKTLTEEEKNALIEEEIKEILEEEEAEGFEKQSFSQKIKGFFDKIKEFILKCKNKCYNVHDSVQKSWKKFQKILKDIEYYKRVLEHPAMKPAWELVKKHLIKIIKNIRPRKVRLKVICGAEDPSVTAKVFGYYCMIYPFYRKSIQFTPDWETPVFVCEGYIKGRMQLYRMLLSAWAVYSNRNCRKIFRLLKREGKKRGRKQ